MVEAFLSFYQLRIFEICRACEGQTSTLGNPKGVSIIFPKCCQFSNHFEIAAAKLGRRNCLFFSIIAAKRAGESR